MHAFTRFICLALLPLIGNAADRGPDVPDYPADKVAENVYVIHGPIDMPSPENQGFMNNPGIVITDAGTVIMDPGSSVQSGEMVLRVARTLSDKPVIAVFNSHIHGDHWLGNQAVRAAYPDAAIYGHPNMIELIKNGEGENWLKIMDSMTEGKTAGTEVVGPETAINHGDEIRLGKLTFRIHYYGKAHTTSDAMVEIVEPGVVFTGDNVLNGRIPRIDGGSITGVVKANEEIIKSGASVYVPGHGKTGGVEVVNAMHRYFDTVYSNVKRLFEDGQSDFEMKDEIAGKLQDYASWESFDEELGKHISYSYLQVEEESF